MRIWRHRTFFRSGFEDMSSRCLTQIANILFLVLALILFNAPCQAQSPTAQLTGLVTDPSGAVVPGAQVQITNVDTGGQWKTATTNSGYYTEPELPPGHYSITIRKQGFMTSNRTGITLTVSQVARIDFALKIGARTQTVSVTGAAPLLESQTASLGQVVETRRINDLPLNGRDYVQLAKLTAGVTESSGALDAAFGGKPFVANGVLPALTNFNLDGVDNNTRIVNIQNRSYSVVHPPPDAIQEFKLETSNYSAQFGYSAGAVVNATLKSGTNQIHGDVYEFLRNDHLDARDYFQPADTVKPVFQRNQFGATLGGPIIHDKLFMFGSWERTTQNLGETLTTTVPTDAVRQGNFQGFNPIYDPATTQPNPSGSGYIRDLFPNNTIPLTRIDPVAAKLVALLPEPNVAGQSFNNYISNPSQTDRVNLWDGRGDLNISESDKFFTDFNRSTELLINPGFFAPPLVGATKEDIARSDMSMTVALGETHVFSPTLVNEFRSGYTRINDVRGPIATGPFLGPQFGFKGIPSQPGVSGLPHISISGFAPMGEQTGTPNPKIAEVYQVGDTASWNRGRQSFQAGGKFLWVRGYSLLNLDDRGSFSFNGTFTQNPQSRPKTGNGFADFLLGIPNSAALGLPNIPDVRQRYYALFFQDDLKMTPKLTVNAGLRYEIWTPRVERKDHQANFIFGPNDVVYPNNVTPTGIPSSIVGTIPNGVGDRSLVNTALNNWGPRLGVAYHLAHNTVLRAGGGIFFGGPTYPGIGATLPGNPPFGLQNSFPTDQINPNVTFASGFPASALSITTINPANLNWSAFDTNFKWANVYKWSFGLQQEVKGWLVEADYVGDKGTHLQLFYNYNSALPGAGSVKSRRPIQGFGNIRFNTPMGNSSYNGLQTQLKRTFSNGFSLVAAYTYSKSIDIGGYQLSGGFTGYRDVRDIELDRGPSNYDMEHRFVVSYIYALPVGKGKRFGISNPVADAFIGGWQVNGITTIRSGQPFTPSMSFSTANTGASVPDRVCNGSLSNPTIHDWFNTSCFVPATPYNFGNAGRDILIGPGATNFDFSLFKSFPVSKLGESGKIQFRGELFNLFNHPQFSNPATNVSTLQAGTITGLRSSMREIQFALKVVF